MTSAPRNARAAAAWLLGAVLGQGRPLDDALGEALRTDGAMAGLEPRDRAFARLLVNTALRRLGEIDAVLASLLDKPLPTTARREHDLLRLGAAQLLFLGTPAHAAVHEAVRLLAAGSPFRGLLNAVLRRLAREAAVLRAPLDAARCNTPDWLWQSWCAAYGEATARAIALAHLQEPPLDLTAKEEPEAWAARLDAAVLPTGGLRRRTAAGIEELPGFQEGAWWVQDAAAALPARLLGAGPGMTVIDLCAAPGGKTLQLASTGARVIAVDRSASRLERVRENLARARLAAETVAADACAWRPPTAADRVLVDAPCSATGTIRRHPDVAHLKRPADLPKLAALQDRLLDAATAMLAAGGRLVYCVCSLQPEEGPERIAALLQRTAGLTREPVAPDEIGGLPEMIGAAGELRTLPCHLAEAGGVDGFYACRLRKA